MAAAGMHPLSIYFWTQTFRFLKAAIMPQKLDWLRQQSSKTYLTLKLSDTKSDLEHLFLLAISQSTDQKKVQQKGHPIKTF